MTLEIGHDLMLKETRRDSLVLMGVSTVGCVLSKLRWAVDINCKLIVVSDACSNPEPKVHRVLIEEIYPRQGTVLTTQQVSRAQG